MFIVLMALVPVILLIASFVKSFGKLDGRLKIGVLTSIIPILFLFVLLALSIFIKNSLLNLVISGLWYGAWGLLILSPFLMLSSLRRKKTVLPDFQRLALIVTSIFDIILVLGFAGMILLLGNM